MAYRELKQMFSRPIYLFGTVLTLAFCAVFFFTLFGEGLPMSIPIGVVDNDNSSFTREVVRNLNSEPGITVAKRFSEYSEARKSLQRGETFGFVYFPDRTYGDIINGRRPKMGVYYSEAMLVPGTLSYKYMLTMANMVNGAVKRETLRAHGVSEKDITPILQPITLDFHYFGNPWSNYGIYLISIIWPAIMELCILLMTVFSIGYELKTKTSRIWLHTGKGSMAICLFGKLLPYTVIYIIMGIAFELLAYRIVGFPMQGPIWVMFLNVIVLVLSSQAIGIFMIGLFPVLRDAVSFASLYGILAASMAGMSYPIEFMISPLQGWSLMFPLRQYFLIYVKAGVFGAGFGACWQNVVGMMSFMILPYFVIIRLKKALIHQNYPLK